MVVMDGHRTTNRVSAGPFCTASNKSGFRGPAVPGLLALFPVRPQSSEQPRSPRGPSIGPGSCAVVPSPDAYCDLWPVADVRMARALAVWGRRRSEP